MVTLHIERPVLIDDDGNDIAPMNRHELSVFNLLRGKQLSADHPITCLNPTEWFTPVTVKVENGSIWVRSTSTCWFALHGCRIRDAQ